jgi:undecaprenyl diphosphate synthase
VAKAGLDRESTNAVVNIPRHVAIVMDGNGRWAQQHGKKRHAGHREGVKSVRKIVDSAARSGVEILTLFAFSSENWKRPKEEVGMLMDLFMLLLRKEIKRLRKNNVQLRIIGDTFKFSQELQEAIKQAEQDTADNTGLILQIAANYGGRWDIAQAARTLAEQVESGNLKSDQINEELFSNELSFSGLIDPDLFIRTGGEQRLSNFMLWQSAYTEIYFTDVLWPDFRKDEFDAALTSYSGRQRRYGMVAEQVATLEKSAGN